MRGQHYSTSPLFVQNVMNSKFGRQQKMARHWLPLSVHLCAYCIICVTNEVITEVEVDHKHHRGNFPYFF